ncbi:MAG: hypothetical protein A2Y40_09840 [Candidatus Margulisbacteria bacterium GWF2_35_9]|nr:MAG: hypothetical protein A2Y40_09840 [Candidatus Margulisbacteria bacterium GWF2_35_9]
MRISEIFSSIQGEGIYVGYRQIFIRFSGCNISCAYCDEENHEGKEYSIDSVVAEVKKLNKNYHHSISITGGEPLLQINDLLTLLPKLTLPIYLETNSTLPAYLKEIKDLVSIFSLDLKPEYFKEFLESLEMVKDEDAFIKYVLLPSQQVMDYKHMIEELSMVSKDVPFIIQPVTPTKQIKHFPDSNEIISAYTIAKKYLNDVRVIPQTHKIMNLK